MKKKFLQFAILLLIFGCSKEENSNGSSEEPDTNSTKIDGVSNINYDDLTVVSFENEVEVNQDGGFQLDIKQSIAEELPLLFVRNGEVLYGYYNKTGPNQTVSIDDILLFYLTLYPDIVQQGLQNSALLDKIKADSNYNELTSLVKASLNTNTSPFTNDAFVSLLTSSGLDIAMETRGYKQSGNNKLGNDDFKFTYSRDGTIIWDKQFPLYATVGMEILDTSTGKSVSGPQIFDKKGLLLSPGSWVEWVYDYLITEESENYGTFKLPKEGKYDIKFTNGVDNFGTEALESKVDLINRFNIGVNVLSFVMPVGIKKWLGENECRDALIDIFKNLKLVPTKLIITDKIALDKFMKDVAKDVYVASVKCIPNGHKKYLAYIESVTKYFNLVEQTSNLYLLLKDYLATDIRGWETRYYYDGISFGELELTNTSGLEFITPTGTEFTGSLGSQNTFSSNITETTYLYSIDNGLTKSIMTSEESKEFAYKLPFDVNKTNSGDATLKVNNNNSTNIEGNLAITFVMGEQESEFEIKPTFKNSKIETEKITLKQIDLSGIWNIQFSNSTCNGSGSIQFNNNGTITFINQSGLNEDVTSSTYSLNDNTLIINHVREYGLCEATPGSAENVNITESITIEVVYNNLNNFSGTFSNVYSGEGLTTCNAQNPSCSGSVTISK